MATQPTTRTWKTAYEEVKNDLDRAVARNNDLADRVERLEGSNKGLQRGNDDTRLANSALQTALQLSQIQHRKDLELIRDGKTTAAQALEALRAPARPSQPQRQRRGGTVPPTQKPATPAGTAGGDDDPFVDRVLGAMGIGADAEATEASGEELLEDPK